MRSLIARLSLAGIVGIALAGCGSGGTSLPSGGFSNGSGGGGVNGTGGVGALPTCSEPAYLIDNGNAQLNSVGAGTVWVPFLGFDTDNQGVGDPTGNDYPPQSTGWPEAPPCVPAEPFYTGSGPSGVYGYHQLFVNGGTGTQVIMKYAPAMPNLTYKFGYQGNAYYFNYTAIVLHINWPSNASLAYPSSIAVELVGNGASAGAGALASTYDVRSTCTAYPAGVLQEAPAWSTLVCPLNGGATAYGTAKNSQGPNAIVPGAAGTFTPINPAMYLVFNYGKATNPSQEALVGLTYVYAYQ